MGNANAGVSAPHQHQLSMHREQIARLVCLIRCQTKRIVRKSRSGIAGNSERFERECRIGLRSRLSRRSEERSFEYPSQVGVADVETASSAAGEVGCSLIIV